MGQTQAVTPMFRQYNALKKDHPGAILLFRMGDFYEMFHEDAKVASRLLELTLTARGKGTDNVVPMCGFPHHQLNPYTARLVRAGQRVAICDQVEDPKKAKGLVRREVVRMVTPGTVTDPEQLSAKENLWVAAVGRHGGLLGAAVLDVSTGEFLSWQSTGGGDCWAALEERLREFGPREVVYPDGFKWSEMHKRRIERGALLTEADAYSFGADEAAGLLRRQFDVATLDGFGFRGRTAAIAAAGGLLQYLLDTQKSDLQHLSELRYHEPSSFLQLDPATRRNLEIDRSLRDGGERGSLVHAVDRTVTPAGGRLLRRWLYAPLRDVHAIEYRQAAVDEFVRRAELRDRARSSLDGVRDVERLTARAVAGTASPRDMQGLRVSLDRVPGLLADLASAQSRLVRDMLDGLDPCDDVRAALAAGLVDDPPARLSDGGVIRPGFNAELDELRTCVRDNKSTIAAMEAAERERTGIASLKVKFNKVFGYFIEVSKSNLHLVPDEYVRKQTIASGERFITPQLKEYESTVLHAEERIDSLETELFQKLRFEVAGHAPRLKAVAFATATLDVLSSFAELAVHEDYRRPTIEDSRTLTITGGRHPVVEQTLVDLRFVPNDTVLDGRGKSISVLTGPNMGGKSTYLRQVALIALLAQTGCFVPVDSATVGVVDRIFCRVGASDSLSEGQSTFMVEMSETANILHNASGQSLVLLDEIGRGTSTFDGLSIAWSVVEHLAALAEHAPRTLFATHYHELTELATELDNVANLRMAVRECDDGVVFTHRVEDGASDRSYGIHVARLAGIPKPVVKRAEQILGELERDEYGEDGRPRRGRRSGKRDRLVQPTLFGPAATPGTEDPPSAAATEILGELREQSPDSLTPLDALNLLATWKRRLEQD